MREATKTGEPLKHKNNLPESVKLNKERSGWRRSGVGEIMPWTPEQLVERKHAKDMAMADREKVMAKIREEFPDIK